MATADLKGDALSHLSDHFRRDRGLTHDRLAPALDPVDSSRFLVSAVVPANGHHLQRGEVLLQDAESLLCPLQGGGTGNSHVTQTFHQRGQRDAG